MKKYILIFGLFFTSLVSAKEAAPGQPGRYQLIQLGTFRSDQYLLDTQTGKVWRHICAIDGKQQGECDFLYWQSQTVENLTSTTKDILEFINVMKKAPESPKQ